MAFKWMPQNTFDPMRQQDIIKTIVDTDLSVNISIG